MVEKFIRKETEVEALLFEVNTSFTEIADFLKDTSYHCDYSIDNRYMFPERSIPCLSPDVEINGPSKIKLFPGDILVKDNEVVYKITRSNAEKMFKSSKAKEELLSW